MKKALSFCLLFSLLLGMLTACSAKWTDEDLSQAHTVEITEYGEDYETKTTYTITDERTVNNLRHTFSLLALKRTRIQEPAEKSFHIRFLGANGEIDHITILAGHNVVQDRHGELYRITDDMDINRHLREVLETAPADVTQTP